MDRAPLLILLLLAGCGAAPDFVTERGVEVYLQGHDRFIDRAQADRLEAWLEEGAEGAGYPSCETRRCLAQARVLVVDDSFRCFGDRACAGEQWGSTQMVVDTGCPFSSAYLHELAHWLQQCSRDGYDPDHEELALWRVVRSFPPGCP